MTARRAAFRGPTVRAACISLLATLAMLALLFVINPQHAPLDNTRFVDQVRICETDACDTGAAVALPFQVPRTFSAETRQLVFQIPDLVSPANGLTLYLPNAPRAVAVQQAGQTPDTHLDTLRRPVLLDVPGQITEPVLTARWPAHEGLMLYPFHAGAKPDLVWPYYTRLFLTYGLAQASLVLMLASLFACTAIFVFARTETVFLWLAISNLPALIIAVHYLMPVQIAAPGLSVGIAILAADAYVACLLRFMNRLVGVHMPRAEALSLAGCVAHGIAVLSVEPQFAAQVSAAFALWGMCWAIVILTVFQMNRQSMNPTSFLALFALLTLSLALSAHDWVLYATDALWWGPSFAAQALPATMGAATLWLVVQRLLATLQGLETLNAGLETAVAAQTRQLEDNYERLAQSQTRAALETERSRIMTELHDGVGGQIVNVLSYVEEGDTRDPVLESALEDALRDIGVIMDSIAALDAPVDSVLGGLRHRYEPLFERLGMRFDWQVRPCPDLPDVSPEHMLDFVRIVQETLNNIAKHAQATTVTVRTAGNRVTIEDDGLGLTSAGASGKSALSSGMGLRNMQRRARILGVTLTVEDRFPGTRVDLRWT